MTGTNYYYGGKTMKTEQKALGLLINHKTETDYYSHTTEIKFDFSVVEIDSLNKITNLGHSFSDNVNHWLDGVAISARYYTGEYNKPERPYDQYISIFFDDYKPGLREVERAAKALRKIETRMDKMNKDRGYVLDSAESVGRFCEACGIKKMVEVYGKNHGWHNENDHRFMSVGEGVDSIRWILKNDSAFQTAVTTAMGKAA